MGALHNVQRRHRLRVPHPRRYLTPLRRACLSLGLAVNAKPTTDLALSLHRAGLGRTGIDYLRQSKDEQARQIVDRFNSLGKTERKAVTIDYLLMATGTDEHHVWGVIQEEYSRWGALESSLVSSSYSPAVLRKVIENAMRPGGHKDRLLFFRIAGMLPTRNPQLRSPVVRG